MSTQMNLAANFSAVMQDDERHVPPPWRVAARESLLDLKTPDRKQEDWRYTPLDKLFSVEYAAESVITAASAEDIEAFAIPALQAWRLVLVNGQFQAGLSQLPPADCGLTVTDMYQAMTEDSYQPLETAFKDLISPQPFSVLNAACAKHGVLIDIAADSHIVRPIELLNIDLGLERPVLTQPRLRIHVGERAQAVLIERHVSHGESSNLQNLVSEIRLDQGAVFEHFRLQETNGEAKQIHQQFLLQGAESRYQATALALGTGWNRSQWHLCYSGSEASSQFNGAYVVGEGQYTDNHLDIHHNLPGCRSQERFHGILNGNGRAVFDGKIKVYPNAQKTDASLNNHNLMLSRDAEVDTKPQLQIHADDVACSHGATVGQIEQDALFYLRSRGITEQDAVRMICHGFVRQIHEACEITELKDYIEQLVALRLAAEAIAR